MSHPRKHVIRIGNFALSLVSTVIAIILFIAVFEIVNNVRYATWRKTFDNQGWFGKITVPSENPVLMWEYRPYGEFEGIRLNRWGFRGIDFESMEKPENTYRVAFAGDSVALGYTVGEQDTFVRQFEVEANVGSPRRRVEALNFGIDGYHAVQIAELVRTRVLAFSPDVVVYAMCMNDFDFYESSGKKIRYFKKPGSWFLRKVERLYRKWSGTDFHMFAFRKNRTEVLQALLDTRVMLEHAGVDFQLLLVPIFPDDSFENYPIREMHEEIGAFCLDNGIRYHDLLDAFVLAGREPRDFSVDVWHPNAEGHRFIAQQAVASVLPD